MARALFQSWFVDFDPVRAKLDGRQPTGMDSATAALFPSSFQESTLGPIPKGWTVAELNDVASITMGLSPAGDSYNSQGEGDPLINGPVEFGNYFPTKTKWTNAATRFCDQHDLIFCVRGSTTGKRVIADGRYAIGRGVCAIAHRRGCHSFLYQVIDFGLGGLLAKTTGSVFPNLNAPDLKAMPVVSCGEAVLHAYERLALPWIQQVQHNQRQSSKLSMLRDALLPPLLRGELSVQAKQ